MLNFFDKCVSKSAKDFNPESYLDHVELARDTDKYLHISSRKKGELSRTLPVSALTSPGPRRLAPALAEYLQ
jgi:hypothetical protein